MAGDIEIPGRNEPNAAALSEAGQPSAEQSDSEASEESVTVVIDDTSGEFERTAPLPYLIAAIGASAGGLEAYIELLRNVPPNTGMAFVVIPHLLPDFKSHLVDILARNTSMTVSEIVHAAVPEPDHVYVLPPNMRCDLDRGRFRLAPREPDVIARPIDFFFRSLAGAQKTRAVGVVLSGTDSDGALGLRAIKGEGGIALVQSPDTARFSDMPRNSISVDHVDRILPPAQIGIELAELARQFREPGVRILESGRTQPGEEQQFSRILSLMRGVSGVDFRLYKPSTIRRRIARRMLLHRFQTLAEYVAFVQTNPRELRDLQEDALINVTHFFRDNSVFESLKQSVLPRILDNRPTEQQVRIWVAGCSTGEEVYSIAMCLLEHLTGQPIEPPIQIFGTDASDINIHKARAGIFPESITDEVSPERLRRFFVKIDKGYQVAKRVRDLCLFARQNLCHDPPFSKMDLISCRNVLIYMGNDLQKQILPTFHYALSPGGYLILGASETIREFTDLFHLTDRRNKIFVKIGASQSRALLTVAPRFYIPEISQSVALAPPSDHWGNLELQHAADRIVLARYGPPGVVINDKLEILQSRGHTSRFIEMPQGTVNLQLTRMLSDSIAAPVSQAVRHAIENDVPVRVTGLSVSHQAEEYDLTLEVLPIPASGRTRCFLVLFAPPMQSSKDAGQRDISVPAFVFADRNDQLESLRQDLAATKLYLQTLLEERDIKNQEMVSANEEIQSANEEMQSSNEELETTKEELQSSNEELQTVNEELQQRNTVLTQATNDLSNLLNSVNLPVLMLSNDLQIRHFTPPAQRLMNLRQPDVGRPFSEIRINLNIEDLQPLFHQVLDTLTPQEIEVEDRDGRWYLLRVRPYRTTDNRIEGVVVVLLDIDQLRRSQQELRGARDFARSVIECVPLPLAVVDLDLNIRAVNDAFRSLARIGNENLDRRSFTDVASRLWRLEQPLVTHLNGLRTSQETDRSFEFEHQMRGENPQTFKFSGRVLKPDGELFLLVTIEDITSHKEVERLSRLEQERLAGQVASATEELGRTQGELRALAGSLFTSQEDERRRVAHELHDDISQKLAILGIDCRHVESQIPTDSAQAAQGLARVRTAIESLSEDVRRISHGLHPSAIDDLGLAVAMRALVDDFRERAHMIANFSSDVLPEISGEIATGLYRITQEGLRNIEKHAGDTHVKVVLRARPSGIRLQIIDAGDGFDLQGPRSGLGLIGMEERARAMGAAFSLESELGDGTRITVDVPLLPAT
jgi:two-component system CheB/CheR fusion protein